jgi:hypothetical protein
VVALIEELRAKIASFVAAVTGPAVESFGTATTVKARHGGTCYSASRSC